MNAQAGKQIAKHTHTHTHTRIRAYFILHLFAVEIIHIHTPFYSYSLTGTHPNIYSTSLQTSSSMHNTVRIPFGKNILNIPLLKFNGLIGHSTSRINRLYNDDSYSIHMLNNHTLNISLFDGHGKHGSMWSTYLKNNLFKELIKNSKLNKQKLNKNTFMDLLYQYTIRFPKPLYWYNLYLKSDKFYDKFIHNCNTKQERVLFDSTNQGSRMIFDKWGNIIDKTSLLTESERLLYFYTYLKFDLQGCLQLDRGSGSTASSIFISPFDKPDLSNDKDNSFLIESKNLFKLVVTQIGDSKILICDSKGVAHNLSKPHHVTSKRESIRLNDSTTKDSSLTSIDNKSNKSNKAFENYKNENDTATLSPDFNNLDSDSFGKVRFLNNYANTRSFGDFYAKSHGISAEPDIYSFLIGNTVNLPYSERTKLQFGGDECFIALVTDGVTDLLTDQEIVDLITTTVNNNGLRKATPQFVTDEVIKFISTIAKKDADNATCLVLRLPNWGNWPTLDRTGANREKLLLNM